MREKNMAKSPLLYIQQPGIRAPKASMQSHYKTPKKQHNHTGTDKVKKQHVNRNFFNHKQTIHDEVEKDAESRGESSDADQQADVDMENNQERKKFKDMNLEERIDYFLNAPDHVPVLRAEIKTAERNYRGKIVDYQDNNVYMRVGRRTTPTEIPFETIKEIRLIGF
ncbi:CotO family spore coat protein [Lentibacillus salinarum]|uniref:CotO family spore coat protein n=1 Tax=Lentibacillus salinarum TaxID=446820 RepID=A0ABW3ZQ14_9BACI